MDEDGDFVVVWAGYGPSDPIGVYAQRYSAAGSPQGQEFRVNTLTRDDQVDPSVAMDADGDFVVVWTSEADVGTGEDVQAQRYNASGAPQGGEFRVNTYTTDGQDRPAVAMDADGDFVVVWTSGTFGSGGTTQDGSTYGVYAQRYDTAGVPQGAEFLVNTRTAQAQRDPTVGMDTDGDFVIVWLDEIGAGYAGNLSAQRYSNAGNALGGEFRVNTNTVQDQRRPTAEMDADGDFVVAWESENQDGSDLGIYARRFNAEGGALSGELPVNTYTTQSQSYPSVATDADGDFVVVWQSREQEGLIEGIYAQRYSAGPVAVEPTEAAGASIALAPSPVGPSGSRVRYEVPVTGLVRLSVYDALGREVTVLVDGERAAGPHTVALDADRLAPGVYVVRLTAGASSAVRRVTVAR
jgi:hypothetical protein